MVPLHKASNGELQLAARRYGGDEAGLLDLIEAETLSKEDSRLLRNFLARLGVETVREAKMGPYGWETA